MRVLAYTLQQATANTHAIRIDTNFSLRRITVFSKMSRAHVCSHVNTVVNEMLGSGQTYVDIYFTNIKLIA